MVWSFLGMLMLVATVVPVTAARPGGYRIVLRWKVGGDGGWDLLTADEHAHRLYYGRGNRVQVLDLESGRIAGEIPDTPGIHGVALAPETGRGFSSNGRDSSVTIFDLKSLATIARIHLEAQNPDAILHEPHSGRILSFNTTSHDVTAIDAASGAVVGTLGLDGQPELAVADGRGNVFVNLEDSSTVVGFDARSLRITSRWSLVPGEDPTGLAIDRSHHRLFSACANGKMIILDEHSGREWWARSPLARGSTGPPSTPGSFVILELAR